MAPLARVPTLHRAPFEPLRDGGNVATIVDRGGRSCSVRPRLGRRSGLSAAWLAWMPAAATQVKDFARVVRERAPQLPAQRTRLLPVGPARAQRPARGVIVIGHRISPEPLFG